MTFEVLANLVKEYPGRYYIAILVCGIILGYLLRVITFRLHILRLRKQSGKRNMIVIQSRNRKAEIKQGNEQYYQYIKNSQYKSEK